MSECPLLISVEKGVGRIVLNRPQALNAVNQEMVIRLFHLLDQWAIDPEIQCVVIFGAGDRAFSAGGDLRQVYEAHKQGKHQEMLVLFQYEYQLNHKIHCFPKPYISFYHGFGMGGGLGVSVHGSYRLICEGTQLAMPEVSIGFFPDVGASYFLNRCPGFLGLYLALTGNRLTASDALYTGLATHYVQKEDYETVYRALMDLDVKTKSEIDTVLKEYQHPYPSSPLQQLQPTIDCLFNHDTFEAILKALEEEKTEIAFAQNCLSTFADKSPTSLKVTFALMKKSQGKPLYDTLQDDFLLAQKFCRHTDFFEGIRAMIIDKDYQPHWHPKKLEDVTENVIEEYFNPKSYPKLFEL